jgi:hypothetical protein
MWDLDDWKDFAEVVKNFADTALAIVAALALLKWSSPRKNDASLPPGPTAAASSSLDEDKADS